MTFDKKLFYRVSPSDWYKNYPFMFEIESRSSASLYGAYGGGALEKRKSIGDLGNSASDQYAKMTGASLGSSVSLGGANIGSLNELSDGTAPKDKEGVTGIKFYLPIPPQHLSVQSVPATEATATIGGVVEETSYPVFHMINLSGTTGMSVGNAGIKIEDGVVYPVNYQRRTFEDLTGTGNVVGRAASALVNFADNLVNLLALTPEVTLPFARFGSAVETPDSTGGNSSAGGKNGPVEVLDNPENAKGKGITDRLIDSAKSGLGQKTTPPTLYSNGFAWDHGLRQFFMIYQREKSKNPTGTRLYFRDVKSNTRYRCIPRGLQFTRSSASPYITIYNIVLKAWDLKDSSDAGIKFGASDRFKGDLSEVYAVNMTAMISRITRIWVATSSTRAFKDYALGDALSTAKGSFFG